MVEHQRAKWHMLQKSNKDLGKNFFKKKCWDLTNLNFEKTLTLHMSPTLGIFQRFSSGFSTFLKNFIVALFQKNCHSKNKIVSIFFNKNLFLEPIVSRNVKEIIFGMIFRILSPNCRNKSQVIFSKIVNLQFSKFDWQTTILTEF